MSYPFDVPSIAQVHTPLMDIINVPIFEGVNAVKNYSEPLDGHTIINAEHTIVGMLSEAKGELVVFIQFFYILQLMLL